MTRRHDLLGKLFPYGRNRWIIALTVCAIVLAAARWLTPRKDLYRLKFPAVDPDTSCGVISLAVVGRWLDVSKGIQELNRIVRIGESGTCSLLDLRDAANTIGLSAVAVRLNPLVPMPVNQPVILHMHDNHFVAALPLDQDYLVFVDLPAEPKVLHRKELTEDWKGAALVLGRRREDVKLALAKVGIQVRETTTDE
jgi:ABC-type bacteriocin/lantibiotic exporter with double-glycine peptidase domain